MQLFAGPGLPAEPALSQRTQLPQSRPGALCEILVRGNSGQKLADQSIQAGIP
jgi:hypothetical protein